MRCFFEFCDWCEQIFRLEIRLFLSRSYRSLQITFLCFGNSTLVFVVEYYIADEDIFTVLLLGE